MVSKMNVYFGVIPYGSDIQPVIGRGSALTPSLYLSDYQGVMTLFYYKKAFWRWLRGSWLHVKAIGFF